MTNLVEKRAQYHPEDVTSTTPEKTDIELYLWEDKGAFFAAGFYGRVQKPKFFYRFQSDDRRKKSLVGFIADRRAFLERKAATNKPHSLKTGDILYSSWGYGQTNINFYQVTKITGKHFVEVAEIASDRTHADQWGDRGTCTACRDKFTGDPMRRKANVRNAIALSSFEFASPWDGKPRHWSSDH